MGKGWVRWTKRAQGYLELCIRTRFDKNRNDLRLPVFRSPMQRSPQKLPAVGRKHGVGADLEDGKIMGKTSAHFGPGVLVKSISEEEPHDFSVPGNCGKVERRALFLRIGTAGTGHTGMMSFSRNSNACNSNYDLSPSVVLVVEPMDPRDLVDSSCSTSLVQGPLRVSLSHC